MHDDTSEDDTSDEDSSDEDSADAEPGSSTAADVTNKTHEEKNDEVQPNIELTPMQEINLALKECGFGRFNIRLLCSAFVAACTGVNISSSTSFLLPAAECDLDMNLVQKGLLNAAPYTGMLVSGILAGFLTDTFGRKIFLLIGFGGIFIFTVIAALSQTYEVLVTAKFFEGVLFAVSFNPFITMTSEYCYAEIRDRTMLVQSSFIAMAQVVSAGFSWAVLVNDWEYTLVEGYVQLHVWNFYLLICSLFSLTAFVLYSFIPESPKFLVSINKYNEARNVLIKVYRENTGKPADTFLYYNIWIDRKNSDSKITLVNQMSVGLHNTKPMFRKPLGPIIGLICGMHFMSMLNFNVLRLWYPQLSTIIENYSHIQTPDGPGDLCVILDTYTAHLKNRSDDISAVCVTVKTGSETYINNMILGCICVIPYLVSGVLIKRILKKYLICACGLSTFAITLGLRWTVSKPALVTLFSLDVALSLLLSGLFQNMVVEFFPTNIRTLAVAFHMLFGRIGTLVGNVLFPVLLNLGCVIPFYTLAFMMLFFAGLSSFLPRRKT